MTLYREAKPDLRTLTGYELGSERKQVVPVEPDYEAAKMAVQAILNEALPDDRWMTINAHMIVDAALGIGEGSTP